MQLLLSKLSFSSSFWRDLSAPAVWLFGALFLVISLSACLAQSDKILPRAAAPTATQIKDPGPLSTTAVDELEASPGEQTEVVTGFNIRGWS